MVKKLLKDVQVGDVVYFSNESLQGTDFKPCVVTCKTPQQLTLQQNGKVVFNFVGVSNEIELMDNYEEINRKGARIVFSKVGLREINQKCKTIS